HAHAPALVIGAVARPGRLAIGVDDHHIRHVDGGFLGDNPAALRTALGTADPGVLLDPADTLDEHPAGIRVGLDHLALGALVLAGDHQHGVAFTDLHLLRLRGQRDDLHEPLVAQLAADRTEDAGAARLTVRLDQDSGVLVEPDVGTVRAALLLGGAHDDGLDHIASLDVGAGDGFFDGRHDDVPDAGVAARAATEHPDAQNLLGTRVVGDPQSRLLLDHVNSLITWPSRGSEPGASAWSPTAGGSPSTAPDHRYPRRWPQRGPSLWWWTAAPCRTTGASCGPQGPRRPSCPSCPRRRTPPEFFSCCAGSRSCRTLTSRNGIRRYRQTQLTLVHHGVDAGDVPPDRTQPAVVVHLSGSHLETQVEHLLFGL